MHVHINVRGKRGTEEHGKACKYDHMSRKMKLYSYGITFTTLSGWILTDTMTANKRSLFRKICCVHDFSL
jgi:hypothetical protein